MNKTSEQCILFQNAFLHSSDAIILTDLKGIITDVNNAFCTVFGWSRSEVVGQTTNIIRSDKTDNDFYSAMWQSIQKNGEWKGEITNRHKAGHDIPVLLSITPIIQDGKKMGYMGIEIDMTEQLKLQQHVAQSERLATIGKMAAKVAHEIRNPLSSISLNAELLEEEIGSGRLDIKEAHILLQSIMREVDRLANLTNEYLQFSRLPRLQNEKYDVCEIIRSIVDLVENNLKASKINLDIKFPKNPVFLKIDKDQMHRVFLNLLKNSIEALAKGGKIKIAVIENNSHVEIKLSDTGSGISKSELINVFEPFYTTKDIGTGLGLPISKQIVEEHGGTMDYLADEPLGANFLIKLPKNNN